MISSIDVILVIALAAFAVHGFSKGLITKVLSLAALLGGIIIAAAYAKEIALLVQKALGINEGASGVIGVILLFIILFVIAGVLEKLFKKVSVLQIWDRFGGALFGLLEGGVLMSLLLLFLALFDIPAKSPSLQRSYIYSPLRDFAGVVYRTFISETSREKNIDDFFGGAKRENPSSERNQTGDQK